MVYKRILFPDRAEDIRFNPKFQSSYRIYLDHWDDFISFLKTSFERVVVRNSSYALSIFGPQGVGKTMLADKLKNDYEITKAHIQKGELEYNKNNLWHRIVTQPGRNLEELISITKNADLIDATDNKNWVKDISQRNAENDRIKVVIADNAERAYFGASLAEMNESDFIEKKGQSSVATHVAQQFVRLARGDLRKTLFIILGNDEQYLSTFYETCQTQHKGMCEFKTLEIPTSTDKENIVRRNINRLNPVSYWSCIDKTSPENKSKLYDILSGDTTFPETFEAVDDAFADSDQRTGRPANKSLLSFVLITQNLQEANKIASTLAGKYLEEADYKYKDLVALYTIPEQYVQNVLGEKDDCQMLESEMTLRLIIFSNDWAKKLLAAEESQKLALNVLDSLLEHTRIGQGGSGRAALDRKRNKRCDDLAASTDSLAEEQLKSFWSKGAVRAFMYEGILKGKYPGYNTAFCTGFPKRPDILISPYDACSVLAANSREVAKINQTISRSFHAVELTTINNATDKEVARYLLGKLPNYIDLLKEV
ncbi:hypothetical protein FZW96_11225 [Bacillus sp. BGMRC 2118]|nr:hypothetical protein FZW96_11225 [Bacillus sp. BGMRC 2118]